jgi:hypothetical protein
VVAVVEEAAVARLAVLPQELAGVPHLTVLMLATMEAEAVGVEITVALEVTATKVS